MHTKHSNTFFPGDSVRVHSTGKTASNNSGRIVNADPDTGKVKVAYLDGSEEWVEAARVEKTP